MRWSRRRLGLPAALVGAVVVAQVAVVALGPRGERLEPAPVSAPSYFSAEFVERARAFRRPQAAIGGAITLVQLGVLVALVVRPPERLGPGGGAARRPLLAALATGAALSLLVSAAPLPLSVLARERAVDVGLVTQSAGGYAADLARAWAISAAIAAVGALAAVALVRRFPRGWWAGGAVVVVAFGAATVYAGPVVLDPVFNDFEPLPPGQVRSDVLELADRAGVRVGEVYAVDASRRTSAANAYVGGLGSTKRVVLYDNLLEAFPRDELRLVVAHELAHQRFDDLPNGLLYLAIVAPFGMFAVARLTDRLAPARAAGQRPGAELLPALALAVTLVSLAIATVSLQLSREVETRADAFSLRLTEDPESFVAFQTRLAERNVSDPDPLALVHVLLGSHPTTVQRLGLAEAYESSARTVR